MSELSEEPSSSKTQTDAAPKPAPTASPAIAGKVAQVIAAESSDAPPAAPAEPPAAPPGGPIFTEIGAPAESAERRLQERVKTLLVGKPRDLEDTSVFHHVSLVAFLAWVGLGADGLSSSCYGPAEAFANLGDHRFLAIFLSLATIVTVLVISACYRHIIEEFPSGGGGYLVASKLLGAPVGAVSGCALLVDYVLTVTTSIAAAGDALFGILPERLYSWKIETEVLTIIALIVMNLRGIKESVKVLLPIFLVFLVTHALLIAGSIGLHITGGTTVIQEVADEVRGNIGAGLGLFGMLGLLLHAYTLGAGTYTGIEAVSNSMSVMREPRVATAKRTMTYMAISLSIAAGGLMIAYLLLDVRHDPERTMNQVLAERFTFDVGLGSNWLGAGFVWVTVFAEALLLFVAAQAGFIGGPQLLAYMAHDSWMPHWFSNLSERLATHNGIFLMGGAALAALLYTGGNVSTLLIMYSINVFLTFSLSMVGMCRHWWQRLGRHPLAPQRMALFTLGGVMCLSILGVTIFEKFHEGGWKTLAVTSVLVGLCFLTRRHYDQVIQRLRRLDETLGDISASDTPTDEPVDTSKPTAAILVGGYSGLGVHTLLNAVRFAPGHFKNMVFLSVAVVDSGNFKGSAAVDDLRHHTEDALARYVDLARRLGVPAESFMAVGTEPVHELEELCLVIAKKYPKVVFFAGQLLFEQDTWYHRLLHNQTAYSLQRRLQWVGLPMVILPTRVR
ncbi:MAG: APC family permease [Planctomycetia bacterium]|nr:APC family permease [Planctomycetia bacterium]